MFNLIRRFSQGIIPPADRPWPDDPTSNAPQKGRKRRLSDAEMDPPRISSSSILGLNPERNEDGEAVTKKIRREDSVLTQVDETESHTTLLDTPAASQLPQSETEDVKDVTQGVKEVDLSDKEPLAPESVPLPADNDEAELQEPAAEGADDPEVAEQVEDGQRIADAKEEDDVASSVNDEEEQKDSATMEGVPSAPTEESEEANLNVKVAEPHKVTDDPAETLKDASSEPKA